MTIVIESRSSGYLHHQIPPLTPDEVKDNLAAEERRKNPGKEFRAVVPPSTKPVQIQPPPTPTS